MDTDQSSLVGYAVALFGGGGLAKVMDMLLKRNQMRTYAMGAVDHAVETAMNLVTARLEKIEQQHTECERSLLDLRQELYHSKMEIDRMMAGRVAGWGERPPE